MRRRNWIVVAISALTACATLPPVRMEEMSAEAHRNAAKMDRANALYQRQLVEPAIFGPPTASADIDLPQRYPIRVSPPALNLLEAQRLSRHAREHEAAALALEVYEDVECRDVPPGERAACPMLGPVLALEQIPNGIHVHLANVERVDALVAQMRCHQAFARARGFQSMESCPLYVRGIEITRASAGCGVDIRSRDPAIASQIRERVEAQR